jgi:hypothetical protein
MREDKNAFASRLVEKIGFGCVLFLLRRTLLREWVSVLSIDAMVPVRKRFFSQIHKAWKTLFF